jgi:hypothetical protein
VPSGISKSIISGYALPVGSGQGESVLKSIVNHCLGVNQDIEKKRCCCARSYWPAVEQILNSSLRDKKQIERGNTNITMNTTSE